MKREYKLKKIPSLSRSKENIPVFWSTFLNFCQPYIQEMWKLTMMKFSILILTHYKGKCLLPYKWSENTNINVCILTLQAWYIRLYRYNYKVQIKWKTLTLPLQILFMPFFQYVLPCPLPSVSQNYKTSLIYHILKVINCQLNQLNII